MFFWILLCCVRLIWSVEFPNPQKEWRMCGRQKASFVCDPDFILDTGEAEKLDQLAEEFKRSTSCVCPHCPGDTGIQIGIFVKKNITDEYVAKNNAKEFAESLRQKWKIGSCDDDIIIVLVVRQNISNFSLGPSLQGILSEETATQILNDCSVHFHSGFFYQGLESMVNSFNDVIIREQKKSTENLNALMYGLLIGFGLLLLIATCGLVMKLRQIKRRKKSCSNIYEKDSKNHPRDGEEQLKKLNQNPPEENYDND